MLKGLHSENGSNRREWCDPDRPGSGGGEGTVTRDDALSRRQEWTWKLLLEFALPSRQHVADRIAEAVRGLGMQPAEAVRVEQAAMEALQGAMRSYSQDCPDSVAAIRVWTSGASAGSLQLPAPGALEAGQPKDGGWGFFVVQRQEDDLPASSGECRHLVDLFLYQEG